MNLRIVKREDIDKNRWNGCVHYAPNGNVFGYTWYLDSVAREWYGIVEDEYESVFPVMFRTRQAGVEELYQPALLPKAGLYSVNMLSQRRVKAFLEMIPDDYALKKFVFGPGLPKSTSEVLFDEKLMDYSLDLNKSYDELSESFSDEMKKVLVEPNPHNIQPVSDVTPEQLCDLYRMVRKDATEEKKYAYLRVIYNALHRGIGFMTGMRKPTGELIAGNFLIFSHKKITSLLPVYVGDLGKRAHWHMTDILLRSNAEKALTLDFNQSMGEMGALHFGAKEVPYFGINENHLTGWKKWWVKPGK